MLYLNMDTVHRFRIPCNRKTFILCGISIKSLRQIQCLSVCIKYKILFFKIMDPCEIIFFKIMDPCETVVCTARLSEIEQDLSTFPRFPWCFTETFCQKTFIQLPAIIKNIPAKSSVFLNVLMWIMCVCAVIYERYTQVLPVLWVMSSAIALGTLWFVCSGWCCRYMGCPPQIPPPQPCCQSLPWPLPLPQPLSVT